MSGAATPALLAAAFRPFFLLAGLHATLAVPLWLLILWGWVPAPAGLGPVGWHRHEMLLGFVMAVLAGFLLTAAGNWTGRPMPRGLALAALALLWLAGRIAVLAADLLPALLIAAIDAAFPLAVAAALLPALIASGNRRNLAFPLALVLVAGAGLVAHLEAAGFVAGWADAATLALLHLILLIVAVMGGRVIPAFTRNALPEAGVRRLEAVEWPSLVALALLVPLHLAAAPDGWIGAVALAAAFCNGLRMSVWGGRATLGRPILWILHLGYAWLVVGLALEGLAWLVGLPERSLALHALTMGALGSLTLGMMSRVALGHTGRPLAVTRPIVLAYLLVSLATLARLVLPYLPGGGGLAGPVVSGLLWALAFALFLAVYRPILLRPRVDGRPG